MNFPSGGVARPHKSLPQQATKPSVLIPQAWFSPALMEANLPSGGVAWPASFNPQQTTKPSGFSQHVWPPPALMLPRPAPFRLQGAWESLGPARPWIGCWSGPRPHVLSVRIPWCPVTQGRRPRKRPLPKPEPVLQGAGAEPPIGIHRTLACWMARLEAWLLTCGSVPHYRLYRIAHNPYVPQFNNAISHQLALQPQAAMATAKMPWLFSHLNPFFVHIVCLWLPLSAERNLTSPTAYNYPAWVQGTGALFVRPRLICSGSCPEGVAILCKPHRQSPEPAQQDGVTRKRWRLAPPTSIDIYSAMTVPSSCLMVKVPPLRHTNTCSSPVATSIV